MVKNRVYAQKYQEIALKQATKNAKLKPQRTNNSPAPQPKKTEFVAPEELEPLFSRYGQMYGVSAKKLAVIAKCESTYNARAINGPYVGMYQYLDTTWVATRKRMGENPDPSLRYSAEESIKTTAYKISQGGIGAWPVCGKK